MAAVGVNGGDLVNAMADRGTVRDGQLDPCVFRVGWVKDDGWVVILVDHKNMNGDVRCLRRHSSIANLHFDLECVHLLVIQRAHGEDVPILGVYVDV